MKLLILGGTVFLGRHLVEAALVRGHEVTLFNRGQHEPDLYPQVEKLRGDRHGDLTALRGRTWDAAIDTNGYVPRAVRAITQLLADSISHYTFISSISVYADFRTLGMKEDAPVGTITPEQVHKAELVTPAGKVIARAYGETYGPLKALCERTAEETLPGRVLAVRPGLIVGPYDYSDRFTYWPTRVAQGGEVLAPGRPERSIQFIDVRDLAEWIVRMVEAKQVGIYNAPGLEEALTMQQLLEACKAVSGSDAHFTWLSDSFLLEAGAMPWGEIPLWIPENDPDAAGFLHVNGDKAIAAGLIFRPVTETICDTLAWDGTRPPNIERQAGLSRERERELLQAWRK